MGEFCTIQAFINNRWQDVASVTLFGPVERGWQASTYTGYELGKRGFNRLSLLTEGEV